MAKQKIPHTVKRHIKHDGEFVAPGETIDLTAEAAAPLVASGHIEVAESEEASSNTSKSIDRMNVSELKEKAAAANVTIPDGATKKLIIEALAAAGVTE
jgi:hypothetical protein